VCFSGLCYSQTQTTIAKFKTFSTEPQLLRVAVVSCDRPERHLEGEPNMWKFLSQRVDAGEVDLVLHIGDQVYAENESVDAAAIFRHADFADAANPEHEFRKFAEVFKKAQNRLRDVYRFTWNLPFTQKVLSSVPNLMIWSDNDIYNDFTIAPGASQILIKIGQEVYRNYQRQLWDPDYEENLGLTPEEQHFHKYGALGVMMLDMRGNKLDIDGNHFPDNKIVSEKQWSQIADMLADPNIKAVMCCSEIPFVSDPPELTAQKQRRKGPSS